MCIPQEDIHFANIKLFQHISEKGAGGDNGYKLSLLNWISEIPAQSFTVFALLFLDAQTGCQAI